MRNQRIGAAIAILLAVAVATLGLIGLQRAMSPQSWNDQPCDNIRHAMAATQARINTSLPGSNARATHEAHLGDLNKQLEESDCGGRKPPPTTPTAEPTVQPTEEPATCDTHFFTRDPNKVSLRAAGPAVANNGVDAVVEEFFRRHSLDPALMSFNLTALNIRQDDENGQKELTARLMDDCEERARYMALIREEFDNAKEIKLFEAPAGVVGSNYMVEGPDGFPVVMWNDESPRPEKYWVMQITLDSGEVLWFRLACGFQFDVPIEQAAAAARVRELTPVFKPCVSGEPRDGEGNCPLPPREPKPTTPAASPSASPSPEPSASPSPSPSASPSVEPDDKTPSEDINVNPGIPANEQVGSGQQAEDDQLQSAEPAPAPTADYTPPPPPGEEEEAVRVDPPPNEGGTPEPGSDPQEP